jgi:hypothetical protein
VLISAQIKAWILSENLNTMLKKMRTSCLQILRINAAIIKDAKNTNISKVLYFGGFESLMKVTTSSTVLRRPNIMEEHITSFLRARDYAEQMWAASSAQFVVYL